MSIKERRERQKQATREGILQSARQIARTEGWGAVTIRRIADSIDYSPPIIYEYFANKDTLLLTLQRQGFALLSDAMRRTAEGEGDTRERLLAMADAYWRFAQEQPELDQIMHGGNSVSVPLDETLAGATEVGDVVQNALEEWVAEAGAALPDPAGAVEIIWGLLHGLISADHLERIGGGKERTRKLARWGVDALLTAWAGDR